MSDGPTLSLAATDLAEAGAVSPTTMFGSAIAELDSYVARQASAWVADPPTTATMLKRMQAAGLIVKQWRGTIFARSKAAKDKPALLVYLPSVSGASHNLGAVIALAEAWHTTAAGSSTALKVLIGSLNQNLLEQHAPDLTAEAIVYALGEYSNGRPLVSLGLKGLLEVELRAKTMSHDAPSAYSEIMPSAAWLIVRALESIKSDVQEVKIEHFEESLAALPGEESRLLLKSVPDHADRLSQKLKEYDLNHYLFELGNALVLQTKYRVPTVNISAIECGSLGRTGRMKLPSAARARLDFQLVPDQHPERIFELLQAHLEEKNFEGLEVVQLPGALAPSRTPLSEPFVRRALEAVEDAAGKPALLVPISPFSGPLALLKAALGDPPAICTGLGETQTDPADFATHVKFLARLSLQVGTRPPEIEAPLLFEIEPDIEPVIYDRPSIFQE